MTVMVTDIPPEVHEGASQGWNAGFDKLARVLEVEGRPAVPTSGPRGFTINRTFKAPPRKVWEMVDYEGRP